MSKYVTNFCKVFAKIEDKLDINYNTKSKVLAASVNVVVDISEKGYMYKVLYHAHIVKIYVFEWALYGLF